MTVPSVSVIVVSRHRAEALTRCLAALTLQDHPAIEVIVVADPAGLAAAGRTGVLVKTVPFDQANISAARNAGLALAAAPVVAFIDDDAVAEPTWASRLAAPFANQAVVAATGFVRGRNGISFQWQASEVDTAGHDHPLAVDGKSVSLHPARAGRAVKTQGTNCAFRTASLRAVGGFDPAYRFYLDEADVNLRLGPAGLTAIVPLAEVQHGFAASARRRADRVPLTLHEIGASVAVWQRRHGGSTKAARATLFAAERVRALRHMVAGRIEPRDVSRLLATLTDGWDEGMVRPLPPLAPLPQTAAAVLALPGTGPRPGLLLCGWVWNRADLRAAAQRAVAGGAVVTVLCLSPGARRHHSYFARGIWWQDGGLFGRSDRSGPLWRWQRLATRAASEADRLRPIRPV